MWQHGIFTECRTTPAKNNFNMLEAQQTAKTVKSVNFSLSESSRRGVDVHWRRFVLFQVLCALSGASGGATMLWYQGDDEEEDEIMNSPALLARRASESWIDTPPIEVRMILFH